MTAECHVVTVDLGYDCVFSRKGERTGVLGTSRPYILLYSLGAQPMTHATLSSDLAPYTLVVLRLLGALVWPTGGTPAKAPIAHQTAEAGEGVTPSINIMIIPSCNNKSGLLVKLTLIKTMR